MKKAIGWLIVLVLLSSALLLVACDSGASDVNDGELRYGVTVRSVAIELDAPASDVLSALGAWSTYDESPTCAFEGMDKVYGYGAFDVETYTLGGVDYIRAIHLLDDTHTTREGIAIGAARDTVVGVYGEADEESTTLLSYHGNGMRLVFLLRDGVVTNIQYLKNEKP